MSDENTVKLQQRASELGRRRYSEAGLYIGARRVLEEQTRDWFGGLFADDVQRQMTLLLFTIYIQFRDAILITKKQAMGRLKTTDPRTLHRYIQLAIDQDFITVRNSEADRRVDYLCPTQKLIEFLNAEIETYLDEMQFHLQSQRQLGLPSLPPHFSFYGTKRSAARVENLMIDFGGLDRTKEEDDLGWQSRIARYTETLRLFPEHPLAHLARGWAYLWVGELEKALIDSNIQKKKAPSDISSYFLAAEIYKEIDRLDNAIEQYTRFIEIEPTSARARQLRGKLLMLSGQMLDGLKDYVAAVQMAQPYEVDEMTVELVQFLTLSILQFAGNEKMDEVRKIATEALASIEKAPQSKDASERLSAYLDCLQSLTQDALSAGAKTNGEDDHDSRKENG